ncbi:hypothetical protein L218DRAFT_945111 [Marasmius fiardii PR-910]|nr:hypothetical protein L218DRAFT_945111 [Marasmius fiardii PR-910]
MALLDIITEIKLDHENGLIANTLVREMAMHSDAEEVSLYNEFAFVGMAEVAQDNKEDSEHSEVKNEQLPQIMSKLTREQSDVMAREFVGARMLVPTRPHPDAPQTGGIAQKAIGLHGRTYDKLAGSIAERSFVEVKYARPEL